MKVKAKTAIKHDGKEYLPGAKLDIDKKEYERLGGYYFEVLEDDDHIDLEDMTVDELKELAAEKEIKLKSKMNKDEIIETIEGA